MLKTENNLGEDDPRPNSMNKEYNFLSFLTIENPAKMLFFIH